MVLLLSFPFLLNWSALHWKKNKMWMNGYGELKRIFGDLIRRSIHVMKKSNFEPSIIEWFNIDIPHYDVGYWFHIMMWINGFVTFLSFPCERRDPVSIKNPSQHHLALANLLAVQ